MPGLHVAGALKEAGGQAKSMARELHGPWRMGVMHKARTVRSADKLKPVIHLCHRLLNEYLQQFPERPIVPLRLPWEGPALAASRIRLRIAPCPVVQGRDGCRGDEAEEGVAHLQAKCCSSHAHACARTCTRGGRRGILFETRKLREKRS
jgi:hypothetical protein